MDIPNCVHLQKENYTGHPAKVIENGHLTGAMNPKMLKGQIMDVSQMI
jgi:hypothetical protein